MALVRRGASDPRATSNASHGPDPLGRAPAGRFHRQERSPIALAWFARDFEPNFPISRDGAAIVGVWIDGKNGGTCGEQLRHALRDEVCSVAATDHSWVAYELVCAT